MSLRLSRHSQKIFMNVFLDFISVFGSLCEYFECWPVCLCCRGEGGTHPAGDTVHRQTETGQVCFLLQTVPGD